MQHCRMQCGSGRTGMLRESDSSPLNRSPALTLSHYLSFCLCLCLFICLVFLLVSVCVVLVSAFVVLALILHQSLAHALWPSLTNIAQQNLNFCIVQQRRSMKADEKLRNAAQSSKSQRDAASQSPTESSEAHQRRSERGPEKKSSKPTRSRSRDSEKNLAAVWRRGEVDHTVRGRAQRGVAKQSKGAEQS